MCIVRYRPALPRSASISFGRFKRLLDELPDVTELSLQGIGEPLLAPDLYEMIAYAAARGIDVGFNSNATLLTRRAGERLIDAGLGWMCISLDGATAGTYEFVRDGARWETVRDNVERFVALKRERAAERPVLSLVTVLMKRTLPEISAVVEQAAAWGIGRVFVQGLSHDFSDAPPAAYAAIARYVDEQRVLDIDQEVVDASFAAARAVAEREGIDLRLPAVEQRTERIEVDGVPVGCDWPWNSAYVTHTGTVMPCCMVMGTDRVALGNTDERPFVEIWSGEEFRRFRAGLVEGTPHPVCQGCSLYHGTF